MISLEGRTAVVTGGSQGIGRAIALKLAENGADIAIPYIGNPDRAAETVSMIEALGRKVKTYTCDVSNFEQSKEIVAQIIEDFPIGTICLPETSEKMTPTTKTYESLLDAIEEKDVPVTAAKAGTFLLKTDEVTLQILSPSHQDYDNLNDYSIVTRLVVGEKSFLFEGDAEAEVEQEILDAGYDVSCDVLKLGHHGSSTSSSAAYLKAANPEFAVISCGVDNDYGHPHRETMERLQKLSIQEYRTDKQKTLLAETDGKTIQWTTGLHSVIDAA